MAAILANVIPVFLSHWSSFTLILFQLPFSMSHTFHLTCLSILSSSTWNHFLRNSRRILMSDLWPISRVSDDSYCNFVSISSVNVFQSTSVKPEFRSEMLAGSCTAWSMVSSPMVRCHLTRPSVPETTVLTPSSAKLVLANTSLVLYSSIWNQLS